MNIQNTSIIYMQFNIRTKYYVIPGHASFVALLYCKQRTICWQGTESENPMQGDLGAIEA